MAICQVCGCKTDELDFVDGRIGGLEKRVCSFCGRQLKNLEGDSVSEAQFKWLKAVVEKDVAEREDAVMQALKELSVRHSKNTAPTPTDSKAEPQVKFNKEQENTKLSVSEDKEQIIKELTARVDKLEKTIIAMKRSQLIKLICEISLPIILGIIILIIFFSSGFYNTLSDLYSSFS